METTIGLDIVFNESDLHNQNGWTGDIGVYDCYLKFHPIQSNQVVHMKMVALVVLYTTIYI